MEDKHNSGIVRHGCDIVWRLRTKAGLSHPRALGHHPVISHWLEGRYRSSSSLSLKPHLRLGCMEDNWVHGVQTVCLPRLRVTLSTHSAGQVLMAFLLPGDLEDTENVYWLQAIKGHWLHWLTGVGGVGETGEVSFVSLHLVLSLQPSLLLRACQDPNTKLNGEFCSELLYAPAKWV